MNTSPAMIPRKANTGAPKFEADPLNSTFRWELYLTSGRPGNKVPLMDGYSKGLGYENTNRVELLYKKLVNPLLPYLHKCDTIVIYEQRKGLPKDLHPVRLELYPHRYEAFDWVRETTPLIDFLDTYYEEYRRTGHLPPIEDRRKNVRQAFYNPELDHSKYNFRTQAELHEFCYDRARLLKYSAKCMEIWYYKHAEFQSELFENAPEMISALAHAANTAKTAEANEAANSSLAAMLTNSKWQTNR